MGFLRLPHRWVFPCPRGGAGCPPHPRFRAARRAHLLPRRGSGGGSGSIPRGGARPCGPGRAGPSRVGRAAGPPAERRGGEPSPHLSAGATPARRVLIPHFPASGRRRGKTKKGPGYQFPVNSSPCGLVSSLGRLLPGGWC